MPRSTIARSLTSLLVLVVGVLAWHPVASGSAAGSERLHGMDRDRTQVVTFNIYGGRGNAVTGLNDDITRWNASGTVQSRIAAR